MSKSKNGVARASIALTTLAAIGFLAAGCSGQPHQSAPKRDAGSSGSGGRNAALSTAPTTTTTTAPPITTTTTQDPGTAVRAWLSTNEGILQTLQNDLDTINNGGNSGDPTEILGGCQQLAADVTTAQKVAPVPDPNVRGAWQSSLSDFATAAQDCINGINNSDVNLMTQYKTYIDNGISAQSKVAKQIQSMP